MSATAFAVLGFIAWTLLLIIINEVMRSYLVLCGRKRADSFQPDGADVSPFAHRLARAHANCYESFPLIGGVLLLALVTEQTDVTDPLALWLLGLRVAQGLTHLSSTAIPAVILRFLFFAGQLVIVAWWVVRFLAAWI